MICYLIQQMEGAEQCVNYVMKQFEKEAPRPEETKDSPIIRIPTIAYDENGSPRLPIHVSGITYVSDLGHIVIDRLGFHSERYIYPAGFRSSRLYFSTLDPSEEVWYRCEIFDTGHELPLFRVTMDSHPEIFFEANSPGIPWKIIATKARELRGNGDRIVARPGPEYFGLASPMICYLIQQMEGAEQCVKYVVKRFAPQEIIDPVPGASDQAVMSINPSAQNPQPLPGRPICQPRRTWTPEEEETLLRLHRKGRSDWNLVLAALPGRTISAARQRWNCLQQEKIEREENDGVPQPQGDFEFADVAHGRELVMPQIGFPNAPFRAQPPALESMHLPLPRESEMPFVGFPNPSPRSQPDVPATETEIAASIALEQGVMPASGFPNARFPAQPLQSMTPRAQEAAGGSTHASSSWTTEEDSALIRLHDPRKSDGPQLLADLPDPTITAAKQG
jgi:hypothetical protein